MYTCTHVHMYTCIHIHIHIHNNSNNNNNANTYYYVIPDLHRAARAAGPAGPWLHGHPRTFGGGVGLPADFIHRMVS